ncbi:conserved hypothetical protein [Ricinus communis]|uniref:Transmembrane protein n=1 Tax=Ricinus communis TaxID=3988 RepID=B9RF41_RICCO|nr:conserved hypothetical protein [Ricinus communis]|eukprot:XP_002512360.1 uncharacterized protein LOC8285544 [Ricinus communis]
MPTTFHFKSQPFISKGLLGLNPIEKIIITYPQCNSFSFSSKSPLFYSWPLVSLSHKTHIPKPVLCARKKRRGSGFQKLKKILPKLASIAASNLKILPEPFNLVIAEFSGGGGGGDGGGGSWFWRGFDGWRRKRKNINFWFLGFLIVCGLGKVLLGKDLKKDAFYGVLALGSSLTILIKGFRKAVKYLVLELCFVGALMGLRLKRQDMQQWVQKVRDCTPAFQLARGKRRRKGTRFL